MDTKLSELSIFFPAWNEAPNIASVVKKAAILAPTIAYKWEIIIVDDGSSDNSLAIANKLAKEIMQIRVISHPLNRGYGAALREGLLNARYAYVVFTDGDGQFDFSDVHALLEKIDEYDIVIGYRKRRNDAFSRQIFMNLLKVWDFILFGIRYRDIDCGFKMFKKKAILALLPLRSEGAMITTEILTKAKLKGLTIAEVPVNHYSRKHGEQSGGNFFVIARAILESFILYLDIRNKRY